MRYKSLQQLMLLQRNSFLNKPSTITNLKSFYRKNYSFVKVLLSIYFSSWFDITISNKFVYVIKNKKLTIFKSTPQHSHCGNIGCCLFVINSNRIENQMFLRCIDLIVFVSLINFYNMVTCFGWLWFLLNDWMRYVI